MSDFHPLRTFDSALSIAAMTIELLLICGFLVGLIVGVLIAKPQLGCLALLIVPVAMIGYISWWQGQNPDDLRSTSGLDFVFGPLWPSLGAIGGYFVGKSLRSVFDKR